jgi:homocysteine S-methyltransferase
MSDDEVAETSTGGLHLESGNPTELGTLMGTLAGKYPHIAIWGGCCGTWETHLDETARNVRTARDLQAV